MKSKLVLVALATWSLGCAVDTPAPQLLLLETDAGIRQEDQTSGSDVAPSVDTGARRTDTDQDVGLAPDVSHTAQDTAVAHEDAPGAPETLRGDVTAVPEDVSPQDAPVVPVDTNQQDAPQGDTPQGDTPPKKMVVDFKEVQGTAKFLNGYKPVCGNGVCEQAETNQPGFTSGWDPSFPQYQTCVEDCSDCGDGVCELGEGVQTCASDCPVPVCGNKVVETGETVQNCGDVKSFCGDGYCNQFPKGDQTKENSTNCPQDCGKPVQSGCFNKCGSTVKSVGSVTNNKGNATYMKCSCHPACVTAPQLDGPCCDEYYTVCIIP